ncbi:hypothetical protein GCM10022419_134760 [Nonomuraea rosea]|uniref:ABC transporter permease n=1 Tax=Nonomuraea rosea TaxID=638574 RepID=A0ABP7A7F6_9ACTN
MTLRRRPRVDYVFGGAIDLGPVQYIDYMLPGILVFACVFAVAAYRRRIA